MKRGKGHSEFDNNRGTNYAYFSMEQKLRAIAARRENWIKTQENQTSNDNCLIMKERKWTGGSGQGGGVDGTEMKLDRTVGL